MTMNNFTARKLGEVLAFSTVGAETWQRGRHALEAMFGPKGNILAIIEDLNAHASQITAVAIASGMTEVVNKKAESTGQKLRAMRDMYIGEEWDNPTELLEWSGFFEGAAIVHWNLVVGAAETAGDTRLQDLAVVGLHLHHELLSAVATQIKEIGKQKAEK